MPYTFNFEKLQVWKDSKDLAKFIYQLTRTFPEEEKYGMVSQLRRASISVCNNIAEGSGRQTGKDQGWFTTVAYSSLLETMNMLIIAYEMDMINEDKYETARKDIEKIANKLNALRKTQLKK